MYASELGNGCNSSGCKIGTICLELIASERGNTILYRFLVAMAGIEIVAQLVI